MSLDQIHYSLSSIKEKTKLFNQQLDQISFEIKHLENELQTSGISLDVFVEAGEDNFTAREKKLYVPREVNEWKVHRSYIQQWLGWSKDPISGKHRIFYYRVITEDRYSGTEMSTNKYVSHEILDGLSESRPLIEAPIEVRLKSIHHLAKLVKQVDIEVSQFIDNMMNLSGANLL